MSRKKDYTYDKQHPAQLNVNIYANFLFLCPSKIIIFSSELPVCVAVIVPLFGLDIPVFSSFLFGIFGRKKIIFQCVCYLLPALEISWS
jgi:hypothetical protein